jgi:RNA polymerase sigma factor (sigma-70 family)
MTSAADSPSPFADLLAKSAWTRGLARSLLRDEADAEDVIQDAWVAAIRQPPPEGAPGRPWLAAVIQNLGRTQIRRQRRREARHAAMADLVQAGSSPEELLARVEVQRVLSDLVSGLDEPYRQTVLLRYFEGRTGAEIARMTGVPAGTVRWRLKAGLDALRSRLEAKHGPDWRTWCATLTPTAGAAVSPLASGGGASSVAIVGQRLTLGKILVGTGAVAAVVLGILFLSPKSGGQNPARPGTTGEVGRLATGERPASARPLPPTFRGASPPGQPPFGGGGQVPGAGAAAGADPAAAPPERHEALRRALDPGTSPARGNPKAPVTIVMWSEFQCPFCARVLPTLGELMAEFPNDIRLVFKHLPLPFHESAAVAAEAAMAAHEQGKFWQMHDRLFANQDRLHPAAIVEHAQAVGVDVEKVQAALEAGKHRKAVEEETRLAKEADITGTPTFFINGERLVGAQPLAAFRERVEEALAKAKGLPPPERKPAASSTSPRPARPVVRTGLSPFWPPPRVTLPDALLGERIRIPFVIGNAPVRGNPKAQVEILYFTSLACPECLNARFVLEGLLSAYGSQVRVVAKMAPRWSTESTLAAEAGLAAHAQGKFWDFHDAASGGGLFDMAKLEQKAKEAGLDVDEFRAALEDGRYKNEVALEGKALNEARLPTPAFVVNGRYADGTVALVQLVEAAIKKAGEKAPPWPAGGPALDGTMEPWRLMSFLRPAQLFAVERREDAWATPIEKALRPLIESDIMTFEPKTSAVSFECRTSICRLAWRSGKGGNDALRSRAMRHFYDSPNLGPSISANQHFLMVRTAAMKTAEGFIEHIKSRRSTRLFNLRTGRTAEPSLPPERLPKE